MKPNGFPKERHSMIKKLEVNNYKLFSNFALELDSGVNLICGPNGSGKTSILEVLYALAKFLAMPDYSDDSAWSIEEAFPFRTFSRWFLEEAGHGEMSVKLTLESNPGELYTYEVLVRFNFRDKMPRVQYEALSLNGDSFFRFHEGTIDMQTDDFKPLTFKSDWKRSGLVVGSSNNSRIKTFGRQVSSLYAFHLVPSLMKQDIARSSETLDMHGANFAEWRYHNTNENLMKQAQVVEQAKYFIPGLVDIRNIKRGDWHVLAARVKFDDDHGFDIEFNELSDGQKILLALYTILANIPDRSTLIIDEPENFLAPDELQPWLETMNDAWEERDIQFIVISHNPQTLNWYHSGAIIFSLHGKPPSVKIARHSNNHNQEPLLNKLVALQWENGNA